MGRLFADHLEPAWLARAIAKHRCGGRTKWKAYDIARRQQMPPASSDPGLGIRR